MKERELHSSFYIGSLNHRATSSLPRQHEPDSTILESFTNHTPRLHFWTKKLTRFWTQTKL